MSTGRAVWHRAVTAGFDRTSYDAEGDALRVGMEDTLSYLKTEGKAGQQVGVFTDCQSWCSKLGNLDP